MMSSNLSITLE